MKITCWPVGLLLLAALAAPCQNAASLPVSDQGASTAAPAVPADSGWKFAGFNLSGVVDGYWNRNFNYPPDHVNDLRNFDDRAGRFELNMAAISADRPSRPIGMHLSVGGGRAFDIMGSTEKDATGMRFFEEAYVVLNPSSWRNVQLDFGKFDSWASAEVIETPNDWNYSRSLLFVWCTPYYHFGVRATAPLGRHISSGVQLVSGWNNIITGATFRTVGVTSSWTPTPRLTWTNTYYGGPDENTSNRGMRNLYDSVVQATGKRASVYFNLDYLHDRPQHTPAYRIFGTAAAATLQLTRKLSLSPRAEWLDDGAGMATGVRQQIKEFTFTGRYALRERLSAWVEFRNDWSSQRFFSCANATGVCAQQPTVLVGMTAILRRRQ